MSTESDQYVTVARVAKQHGISPKTVRRWIADGTLPAFKVGPPPRSRLRDNRPIRIPASALDAIMQPVTVARDAA
ncbi:MAG: helix-turn-helix domain-containing protein [Micrococcales bacterium]|nr:helix-turn-helix domain-containing protein [Micrococcales bacterium]